MKHKERVKLCICRQFEVIVGRRYNFEMEYIRDLIRVCLGTNEEVEVYNVPNEERTDNEDYRIDFTWGDKISGSIWYLKTNNPNVIYITEVGID
jgi:sensor c-di-GMP phosphodiesterase-like protein